MSQVNIQDPDKATQRRTSARAGGAIPVGSVVKIDPADTTNFSDVVVLATSDLVGRGCGIALSTAADGDELLVCYGGVCDVLLDGTTNDIAIGDLLVASATIAGVLIKDATAAAADVQQFVSPLVAQAVDLTAGTLTKCLVHF